MLSRFLRMISRTRHHRGVDDKDTAQKQDYFTDWIDQGLVSDDSIIEARNSSIRSEYLDVFASMVHEINSAMDLSNNVQLTGVPVICLLNPSSGLNAEVHVENEKRAVIRIDDSLLHYLMVWNACIVNIWELASNPDDAIRNRIYNEITQILIDNTVFWLSQGALGKLSSIDDLTSGQDANSTRTAIAKTLRCQLLFLIFHELGHLIGEHHSAPVFSDSEGYEPGHRQEELADRFAVDRLLFLSESDPDLVGLGVFALPTFFDRVPRRGVRGNQEVMDSGLAGLPIRRSRRTG